MLIFRCCVQNVFSLVAIIVIPLAAFLTGLQSDVWSNPDLAFTIYTVFLFTLIGVLCVTAVDTYRVYKSTLNILKSRGPESSQFTNIYPLAYCSKVGYKMAVNDYLRKNYS